MLKNRFVVYVYPPVCHAAESFYFLVCERFPLFAMLKNRCGKKRGENARRSRDNFRAKFHIYYFLELQKLHMAIPGYTPQTRTVKPFRVYT